LPFPIGACDLVALNQDTLWLIEVKDYTYPGGPKLTWSELAETFSKKVFHSLAILNTVAHWGTGANKEFSRQTLSSTQANICLAVELQNPKRRLLDINSVLADIKREIDPLARKMLVAHPKISNSFLSRQCIESGSPNPVPWAVERDPETRDIHAEV
jgi:hypothetical protein